MSSFLSRASMVAVTSLSLVVANPVSAAGTFVPLSDVSTVGWSAKRSYFAVPTGQYYTTIDEQTSCNGTYDYVYSTASGATAEFVVVTSTSYITGVEIYPCASKKTAETADSVFSVQYRVGLGVWSYLSPEHDYTLTGTNTNPIELPAAVYNTAHSVVNTSMAVRIKFKSGAGGVAVSRVGVNIAH